MWLLNEPRWEQWNVVPKLPELGHLKLVCNNKDRQILSQEIDLLDDVFATGFGCDPYSDTLFICNSSIDQNILVYTGLIGTSEQAGTWGVTGGHFATNPYLVASGWILPQTFMRVPMES